MIVVVGGSGFVGTRLCKRLASAGRDFIIVDKSASTAFPERWLKADVCDIESLRSVIPNGSIIINLAAEHRDDVRPLSRYEEVNVGGATNLCKVATEKGVSKFIFTSSVACYGFAEPDTGEDGPIRPFNEYGKTKARAEGIFRSWLGSTSDAEALVIIRPTVIFGEGNRGNVYNLLRQIASGRFVMVGNGRNYKSMAYVENVAAFIEYAINFAPGEHIYNYIDKPDLTMNSLVGLVRTKLDRKNGYRLRMPYMVGYGVGVLCDAVARLTGKKFPISAIRVKKFCSTTQFSTSIETTGFLPPTPLSVGFDRTIQYEFLEDNEAKTVFFTE